MRDVVEDEPHVGDEFAQLWVSAGVHQAVDTERLYHLIFQLGTAKRVATHICVRKTCLRNVAHEIFPALFCNITILTQIAGPNAILGQKVPKGFQVFVLKTLREYKGLDGKIALVTMPIVAGMHWIAQEAFDMY